MMSRMVIPQHLFDRQLFFECATNTLQELEEIKSSGLKSFRDILIDEANILIWTGLIVPVRTICVCSIPSVTSLSTIVVVFL